MKNIKKLCAFFSVMALIIFAAGCGDNSEKHDEYGKTAMVTVGDRSVGDEETRYFLYTSAHMIETYYPYVGWEDKIDGVPKSEYIKTDAIDTMRLYYAIHKNAYELGYGLTAQQSAEIEETRKEAVEYYGSEEIFLDKLKGEGVTDELFRYFNEMSRLYANTKDALYDEYGEEGFADLMEEWSEEIPYSTSEDFDNLDIKDLYENFWVNLESGLDMAR